MPKCSLSGNRSLPIVVLLLLALSAGGCGGGETANESGDNRQAGGGAFRNDPPSSHPHKQRDACKLLTAAEADSVLGGASVAEAAEPDPEMMFSSTCIWKLTGSDASLRLSVLHGPPQVESFEKMMSAKGTEDGFETEISGLGAGAGCTKEVSGSATLKVLREHDVLELAGAPCAELQPAAKAALARL